MTNEEKKEDKNSKVKNIEGKKTEVKRKVELQEKVC